MSSYHTRHRHAHADSRPTYDASRLPRTIAIGAVLLTILVAGVALIVQGLM